MRVAVTARGRVAAPRDRVWTWWTDYTPHDHDHPWFRAMGWRRREILGRDPAGRVALFRDTGRVLRAPTTYTSRLEYDPPREVREWSEGPVGRFSTRYVFSEEKEGTVVTMEIEGELEPGWARRAARIPCLPRVLARADLSGHLRACRADLS